MRTHKPVSITCTPCSQLINAVVTAQAHTVVTDMTLVASSSITQDARYTGAILRDLVMEQP